MKKKVGLIAWHLDEVSGTSTVIRNLLECLNSEVFQYIIAVKKPIEDSIWRGLMDRGCDGQIFSYPQLSRFKWLQLVEDELIRQGVSLIVYFDHHLPENFGRNPRLCKTACVLHDVMPLVLADYYLNPFKFLAEKIKYLRASRADLILTVSDYSRNEMIKKLRLDPQKIVRIHNGLPERVGASHIDWTLRRGILYVGDLRNRKNVFTLAKAYLLLPERIKKQHPLLLTGEGKLQTKIASLFQKRKQQHYLNLLGKLEYSELTAVFERAYLFVFPSIMEGFGLPVIEAQRHSLPVICGDHSALSEVVGSTALFSDVRNQTDLVDKIEAIVEDRELHRRLSQQGYTNSLRFSALAMASSYQVAFQQLLSCDETKLMKLS